MARSHADRACDGRFLTGVRTTRIYYRPVCPVRHAFSRSATYWPSAAAAEAPGFRPCLRCRPEAAPFCPARNGSRTTAEWALRLSPGARSTGRTRPSKRSPNGWAPARHLCRLFERHVGASPAQVAKTARVQLANRLPDGTGPPMAAVALRSGFGSLHRSNVVFAEVSRTKAAAIRRRLPPG